MNCKNCNKYLRETQKFCDECGAKVIQNRLTPKVLAAQVNEQFFSIDNKFLKTLVGLITFPEDVIDGFINGLRKKYINVISFYAIALTVLGFQMFILKQFFPEFLESQSSIFEDSFKAGSLGRENPFSNFLNLFNDYQGVFFSILMPFIAIGTWIIYLDKRKHNYTEHLVINLYITAQTIFFNFVIIMILAIFDIQNYLVASFITTPPLILYGAYILKRLYRSSYINALLRYIAAYIIYTIAFAIIMFIVVIIIVIYLYSTGKINP